MLAVVNKKKVNKMTAEDLLKAILYGKGCGTCEELASPVIESAIRAFFADDRDIEEFVAMNVEFHEYRTPEDEFIVPWNSKLAKRYEIEYEFHINDEDKAEKQKQWKELVSIYKEWAKKFKKNLKDN